MNTLIRVQGWVSDSAIIKPDERFTDPSQLHSIRIQPADPNIYKELEYSIEELKRISETPDNNQHSYEHEDAVIDGSEIIFKSFYKPQLFGDFEDIQGDDELLGKYVQAVGHLKIFKDGNVFLSVHILEPAIYDQFDPLENT